jgi:hypothetical protein
MASLSRVLQKNQSHLNIGSYGTLARAPDFYLGPQSAQTFSKAGNIYFNAKLFLIFVFAIKSECV